MSAQEEKIYPKQIGTSLSHKLYSLVKVAVVFYGLIFILLFANDFWFGLDLFTLSFILAPLILFWAHLFLTFQESPWGCHFFCPLFFEHPIAPYKIWLSTCTKGNETKQPDKYVQEEGFLLGNQMVPFSCIDLIELSFWGNLIFYSNSIAALIHQKGKTRQGQILFKIPISAATPANQRQFFSIIQERNLKLNPRLVKLIARQNGLNEKTFGRLLFKLEEYVPLIGACAFILIFLDFTISTCLYLETHKHFYLSQKEARKKELNEAKREFARADSLQTMAGQMIFSPVKSALFHTGAAASRLWQARAEALYHQGDHKEAIGALAKACDYLPSNYKMSLEMARWLAKEGDKNGARVYVTRAIDANSDSMISRILILNWLYADKKKVQAEHMQKIYLENLDQDLFGEEPVWPPGGNRVVKEGWVKDDLDFLLQELQKGYWSH
ncbi:MAG: tetratricopeptide repeat protein [Candidatus Melainabacteria bacterium]|nr:tetratricopeptide repeat protein [Candidatus Melainabacteria bacterium]